MSAWPPAIAGLQHVDDLGEPVRLMLRSLQTRLKVLSRQRLTILEQLPPVRSGRNVEADPLPRIAEKIEVQPVKIIRRTIRARRLEVRNAL